MHILLTLNHILEAEDRLDKITQEDGDSTAIFGQLTYAIAENWDVTVGARSTEEDKVGFKEYVGIISASGKGSFDDTTGTFILSHDYSDNTNLYFKVADGFKAGGFNAESSNPFGASTPYAPETISSTEFGLKGRYFDNRMMLNVAYFDNEHEDMQISYFTAMLQQLLRLLIIQLIFLV